MASTSLPMEEVELIIANRADELPRVTAALDEIVRRHGLPDAALNMHVALDEILSNIVKYAYDDASRHDIRVSLRIGPRMLEVEVEDDGRAFDPLGAEQQDRATPLSTRSPGRVGVSIVKKLMSEVRYRRDGDRNRLTMRLRLHR